MGARARRSASSASGGADLADLAGRHLAALRDASGESAQFYLRDGATSGYASPRPSAPAGCATPCRSGPGCR